MTQPSDVLFYADVARHVGHGLPYYETAAELHRAGSYPLFPFFTVRLPTLAYAMGYLGPVKMLLAAYGLLLAGVFAWLRELKDYPVHARVVFVAAYAFMGSALISPSSIQVHDVWAGLLVSLALGLGWAWRWQLGVAFLAVCFRELALPILFVLVLRHRRYPHFAAIAAAFGLLALHYFAVSSVRLPTDLHSQGWVGLRGASGFVEHFSVFLPVGFLAFLPLAGWLFRPWDGLWFAGIIFAICVFARPDNLYWATLILPAYPAGIALLRPLSARASQTASVPMFPASGSQH
jgi:hypothetical protein